MFYTLNMDIIEALKEYQRCFSFTDSGMADTVHISAAQWSRIKHGKVKIGAILTRRITEHLPIMVISLRGNTYAILMKGDTQ